MTTGTATYSAASGTNYVTMAGTITSDVQFATQPIVGDQIVYPDALTVSADLTISGSPGAYELWHIIASTGTAVYTSYNIAGGGTATYDPPAAHSVVTLAGSVTTDQQFSITPVAGDQIVYPDTLTVTATLGISGTSGTYTLWHVVASTGTVYNTSYFLGDQVGSGTATYTAGAEYTTATLQSGFDAYVFEGWSPQPVAGEQLTTRTVDGYFTDNGDYITELEHTHDAWFTALDGTITHFTVDSDLVIPNTDTTPNAFGFSAIIDQPTDTLVQSASVQLVGFDAGLDVPISCSAGDFYATSTDNTNWSAWTNTPGFVQLNYYVKLRHRSSASNETTTTATLTVGGVTSSPAFSVTTASALITSPNQFTFTDTYDAPVSTITESSPIVIVGMSDGVTAAASVQGGEWAKSSDSGVTYTAWSSTAGTVTNGDLVKVRATSNATPNGFVDVIFTAATVADTWRLFSEAPDLIPNAFILTDVVSAALSTVYESNTITVQGISPGFSTSVSVTNCEWAKSTDGTNFGAYTTASGSVLANERIKLRATSSSNNLVSVNATLNIGGISDIWTITTLASVDEPDTPANFTFPYLIGQDVSTQVESSPVIVAGVTPATGAAISITGGDYAISSDGVTYSAYTNAAGTINAGQYVKLRTTTSASYATKVDVVLTVGNYQVTWSATTRSQAITQFNIFDPDLQVNRFYGDAYRQRVENNSSNWISFFLFNAGSAIDLSNMTDCKIELTPAAGGTVTECTLQDKPSLFFFDNATGRIDCRIGRIGVTSGVYYLDLVYYDGSHVNGAYMTTNRRIIIELV